ncbi:hypothetical protein H8356DRAFT_1352682 [Neocallimastix lanati (nom. inval.)]|nr:hypothetical protein H8356DRAFT_1352682 [Neocallimastix sp. JGI-2020a]
MELSLFGRYFIDNNSASDTISLIIEEPDKIPTLLLTIEKEIQSPPEDFNVKIENVTYVEINRIKYYSSMTGSERPVIVITPPNYDTNKKYPVLYLNYGGEVGPSSRDNIYLYESIRKCCDNLNIPMSLRREVENKGATLPLYKTVCCEGIGICGFTMWTKWILWYK